MIGIYCWLNKINNKRYIGQSVDIIKRKNEHKRLNKLETYTTNLSKAFKKYGLENFDFIVIEETTVELLDEKEKYWITYYDTLNKEKGYNMLEVGEVPPSIGDLNGRSKLNAEQVLEIRKRIYLNNERPLDVFQDYRDIISFDAFKKAQTGNTWNSVDTSMIRTVHVERENLPKAKLTKEEVLDIRYRHEILKESASQIFEDYADRVNRKTISRVINYETWSNLLLPVSTISEA